MKGVHSLFHGSLSMSRESVTHASVSFAITTGFGRLAEIRQKNMVMTESGKSATGGAGPVAASAVIVPRLVLNVALLWQG